jgi:uncharacterized membrane protein HdeD (DUF308 family)
MSDRELPNSTSLILVGILSIIFGLVAMASPAVAGTAVVIVIGALLLVAGVVQIVSVFRSEGWSSKLPPVILGVITGLAGLGVLGHPLLGLTFLTLLLVIFFIAEGVWKTIASFSYRPAPGWLAMLASGIITLVLGILIWRQWPVSGLWAVGILVGIDLLMTGISLVALGFTVRQLRNAAKDAAAT